jgi:Flp pilus assembly protein TadD
MNTSVSADRRAGAKLPHRVWLVLPLCALLFACTDAASRLEGHLENARELVAAGNEEEAVLELRSALQLAPENVEANNALAEIELRNGRYEVAITHIDKAYRIAPDDPRSALNLARVLVLQIDDLERAKELVDQSVAQDPGNSAAFIVRSNLELARGRVRRALDAADRAESIAPDDPDTAWQRGRALQGRISEANRSGELLGGLRRLQHGSRSLGCSPSGPARSRTRPPPIAGSSRTRRRL